MSERQCSEDFGLAVLARVNLRARTASEFMQVPTHTLAAADSELEHITRQHNPACTPLSIGPCSQSYKLLPRRIVVVFTLCNIWVSLVVAGTFMPMI